MKIYCKLYIKNKRNNFKNKFFEQHTILYTKFKTNYYTTTTNEQCMISFIQKYKIIPTYLYNNKHKQKRCMQPVNRRLLL